MRAVVLRAFPYSDNGLTTAVLPAGWEGEIRDDLAAGLVKERYIAPLAAEESASVKPAAAPAPVAAVTEPRRRGRPKKIADAG